MTLINDITQVGRMIVDLSLQRRNIEVKQNIDRNVRRETAEKVHLKEFQELVDSVTNSLVPMFERQIESAAKRLSDLKGKSYKSAEDSASSLVQLIFDPSEWNEELVNRALPPLAVGTAKAMLSQLTLMGVDTSGITKDSTATEWLNRQTESDISNVVFATALGPVSMSFATEFPKWMKDEIEERLQETFSQPFWAKVNETTSGDIEQFLREGIRDGVSIDDMSRSMAPNLLEEGKYAFIRAKRIAITESGNVLNAARSASIDSLLRDTELDFAIKKVWLSVLIDTTRATHADLHGVPADKDGLWFLGGIRVRWPSDIMLPAGERVNCLCTLVAEFGMQDAEAEELLAEFELRLLEQE